MKQVHREGDPNTGGGIITSIPQSTVYANGRLVSVDGSMGTSHPPCPDDDEHCQGNWVTANGSSTVFIGGIAINRMGDNDTCGHSRASGDSTVLTG